MADDFDDFFDSPRESRIQKKSTTDHKFTASGDLHCEKDYSKHASKPPAHPNSRLISAASKRTLSGQTSPNGFERNITDYPQVYSSSQRVIEAKVPCDVVKQDSEDDGSSSDDSFTADDNVPYADERSGRRSPIPRTVNSRHQSEETSSSRYDAAESSARDLSGSFSDNSAESDDDDSDVTDVSPLNTPHSPPNAQITPPCSRFNSRTTSKPSSKEPVRLLNGDRDSLDFDMLLQTVLQMEKQGRPKSRQAQTQLAAPPHSSRHNYSFTNEQVEAIEKENRRLMTSIMRHANATKKAKARPSKIQSSGTSTKRLSSAAVNRAKEQQKIEAENLVNSSSQSSYF